MNPTAILLCAGHGTRMNDNRTHKVCYEIAGIPAIIRQINNFKQAGISRFVVVVGDKADKVMTCLNGISGIVYAFQKEQKGTGDAALYGLKAVEAMDLGDSVLIAMGDKIISPDVIKKLITTYGDSKENRVNSDIKAVFATQPMDCNKSGGRIAIKNNKVCGIVEKMDVCLHKLGELPVQNEVTYNEAIEQMELDDKKKAILLKKAINILSSSGNINPVITLAKETFMADEIESSGIVNTATYLFDAKLALEALQTVKPNNAQGEIYLTDAINYIADHHAVQTVLIHEPEKILTYSTMDELLKLQKYFAVPTNLNKFNIASEWINYINYYDFTSVYGNNEDLINERKQTIINLLESFIRKYGDRQVIVSRSPGRVNLMGRHIEHRGGSTNVISIDRETLVVASPRIDDVVHISNTDEIFKDYEFSILDSIKQYDTANWVDFIESDSILQMVLDNKGEWVNYVKAGVLRLQLENRQNMLQGMDMLFTGNIPMAAGLSSSSSIVVATMEAAIGINALDIHVNDFINLAGEGEWFVGSRGGSGDHAAMKCGRKGMITHMNFFPFSVGEAVDLPEDYKIVVANSYVEAKKSAGAKDQFNQKVACYEFGFMLVRELYPQYKEKLKHLRDINTENLKIPQSNIYEILLKLPQKVKPGELFEILPIEYHERIKQIQKNHVLPEYYEIRSVILYGLAECARAKKCITLLKNKDYDSLGKMMLISHDGDRVWSGNAGYDYSASDEYLQNLISELRSEEEYQVAVAQIWRQPGGYACSTKTIDELIDYIAEQEGVLGAELSGAGLGGCIIILVKSEKTDNLLSKLKENYYDKNNLPMGAQVFNPVAGSQVL